MTPSDYVDFARDVPTTAHDVEALERARHHPPMSLPAYLDWLTSMSAFTDRPRETFEGWEPFEL